MNSMTDICTSSVQKKVKELQVSDTQLCSKTIDTALKPNSCLKVELLLVGSRRLSRYPPGKESG